MKKIFILSLLVYSSKYGFGQNLGKIYADPKQKIKIEEFKQAMNRQFTKVITGTAFSNVGNFAAISTDAKSFSLAGNFVTERTVWGIELSGGATEGIFKLFNNQILNSNFSGEIKYHRILKTGFASRNLYEVAEVESQLSEAYIQYSKDSLAIAQKRDLYKTQIEIFNSESKISEGTKQKAKVDSLLSIVAISDKIKDSLNAVKGNLEFEIENHKLNIEILKEQMNKIIKDTAYFARETFKKRQLRDDKIIELTKKKKNIELLETDITWFSAGIRFKNNDIKLFAPLNLPATQYSDTSFVSRRVSLSISRFRSTITQNRDFYLSGGIHMDYTTNINSLKKVEIEETLPVNGNPQQAIKKTINAYQGSYEEGIVELTLFCDYYKFWGQSNALVGLHFNPTVNYSEKIKKPVTNLYLGIIVPFIDKEKQASKVSVEIFYSMQDMFNDLNNKPKSSSFGLRAALPITSIK
ncbi:MAG TPA: hypothetical protein PK092_11975 [Chitinophagaceae bacterium]|nr:hypothetical protein [Chitinophagaceae bacterium]